MIDARVRETQQNALQTAIRSATAGTFGDPDEIFRIDFINALLHGGLHLEAIGTDRLNTLVQQAWDDPTVNADWNSQNYDLPGAPTFESYLQKALFSDPSSGIVQVGLGLKQEQGQRLTAAEIKTLGPTAEQVPTPFDAQYFPDTTQTFGQPSATGGTEQGIDYAMPQGTALYSPFAGTISTEDGGKSNWGKRIFVTLDNGYKFAIGHMTNFNVVDGERVNPGELLGESGGNVNDPSSGESTGDHIEVQWIGPDGSYQDPSQIMGTIYGGTTFAKLGMVGASGTGVSKTDAKNRLDGLDPNLNAKYPTAVGLWKQYYGRSPTGAEVLRVAAAGNAQQQEDYIRSLPSQLAGINLGQYSDLRSTADTVSMAMLGHNATDAIVRDLFDGGHFNKTAVQFWYTQQDVLGKMDPKTYNAIWMANQPHMAAVYNEPTGFDPRIAAAQHAKATGGTTTTSQAADVAHRAPVHPGLEVDPGQNVQSPSAGLMGELTPGPDDPSRRERVNVGAGALVA